VKIEKYVSFQKYNFYFNWCPGAKSMAQKVQILVWQAKTNSKKLKIWICYTKVTDNLVYNQAIRTSSWKNNF